MRKLAIGLFVAAGVAVAMPAFAQDVYLGAGPVGVGVDVDHRDHREGWRHNARENDTVIVGEHRRHCRVTIVHRHGVTKKIKSCD